MLVFRGEGIQLHAPPQSCQCREIIENEYTSMAMCKTAVTPLLTHWGREMHICVGEHANIGSYNGLSPNRRQAIIWTNAGILLIEPLGTNFNEIFIQILTFSFKKMRLKVSSAKRRPFCLGLNVLMHWSYCSLERSHRYVFQIIQHIKHTMLPLSCLSRACWSFQLSTLSNHLHDCVKNVSILKPLI